MALKAASRNPSESTLLPQNINSFLEERSPEEISAMRQIALYLFEPLHNGSIPKKTKYETLDEGVAEFYLRVQNLLNSGIISEEFSKILIENLPLNQRTELLNELENRALQDSRDEELFFNTGVLVEETPYSPAVDMHGLQGGEQESNNLRDTIRRINRTVESILKKLSSSQSGGDNNQEIAADSRSFFTKPPISHGERLRRQAARRQVKKSIEEQRIKAEEEREKERKSALEFAKNIFGEKYTELMEKLEAVTEEIYGEDYDRMRSIILWQMISIINEKISDTSVYWEQKAIREMERERAKRCLQFSDWDEREKFTYWVLMGIEAGLEVDDSTSSRVHNAKKRLF